MRARAIERLAFAREIRLRARDPLIDAAEKLTWASKYGAGFQAGYLRAGQQIRVLEGGNQTGKTWTTCIDFLLQARGLHPTIKWTAGHERPTWKGWYCSPTFQRFAEQAWHHWKRLLLYPGEKLQVPTRNILAIGWDNRNPERPTYLKIRRYDGGVSEIYVKSYEQGATEFQSAEVDCLALDEEAPTAVWNECLVRVRIRAGNIGISATAVIGVAWLDNLRKDAELAPSAIYHARLDARDNPQYSMEQVQALERAWANDPEMFDLRVRGIPRAMTGVIYSDKRFTAQHLCQPFVVPDDWTRYRCVDPSFQFTGCLWVAVSPAGDLVAYRDYLGEDKTIQENAAEILALSGNEVYERSYVDKARAPMRMDDTGERIIDVYDKAGLKLEPAPYNDVSSGIEQVFALLTQRAGGNGERPQFRVFNCCQTFLAERRLYKWRELREAGDEQLNRPVRRNNHVLDCWRYLVMAGLPYVTPKKPAPPKGTVGRRLYEARRKFGKAVA